MIRGLHLGGTLADASLGTLKTAGWEVTKGEPGDVIATLRKWAEDPSGFLLLHGSPGVGKTHACVALLRALLEGRWWPVYFTEAMWTGAIIHEPEMFDLAIFLLDDLCSGKTAEKGYEAADARAAIFGLLDRRINRNLPTLVTSNLSPKRIQDEIDTRWMSRLCSGTVIRCGGADRRLKGATG